MVKKSEIRLIFSIVVIFGVVALFLMWQGEAMISLSSSDVMTIIGLLGGLTGMVGCFWAISQANGMYLGAAVVVTGFALSIIIGQMNTASVIISDLETSVTDLQITIIILFIILGIGMSFKRKWD